MRHLLLRGDHTRAYHSTRTSTRVHAPTNCPGEHGKPSLDWRPSPPPPHRGPDEHDTDNRRHRQRVMPTQGRLDRGNALHGAPREGCGAACAQVLIGTPRVGVPNREMRRPMPRIPPRRGHVIMPQDNNLCGRSPRATPVAAKNGSDARRELLQDTAMWFERGTGDHADAVVGPSSFINKWSTRPMLWPGPHEAG